MKPFLPALLSVTVMSLTLPLQPLLAQEVATQAAAKDELTKYDRKFVREALEEGLAGVRFGKLAAEKGGSEEVRKLGQQAAADHEKINAELQELAVKKKIATPRKPDEDDAKDYEKLSKLTGAAFDKRYLEEAIDDHVDAIEEFEDATMKLTDPELKEFAKKTIPVLQAHLQKFREARKSVPRTE